MIRQTKARHSLEVFSIVKHRTFRTKIMSNLNVGLVVRENVTRRSDIRDRNVLICKSPVLNSALTLLKRLVFLLTFGTG